MKTVLLTLLLALALPVAAQHHDTAPSHPTAQAEGHEGAEVESHPSLPPNPAWAGTMLWIVGIMFASAVAVGVIYRAIMPEEPVVVVGHDEEEHGHDRGHGAGGHGAGHGGGGHH